MDVESAKKAIDAAETEFRATTISYPEWVRRVRDGYKGKPYDPAKTAWGRAFAQMDAARAALAGPTPEPVSTGDGYEADSYADGPAAKAGPLTPATKRPTIYGR